MTDESKIGFPHMLIGLPRGCEACHRPYSGGDFFLHKTPTKYLWACPECHEKLKETAPVFQRYSDTTQNEVIGSVTKESKPFRLTPDGWWCEKCGVRAPTVPTEDGLAFNIRCPRCGDSMTVPLGRNVEMARQGLGREPGFSDPQTEEAAKPAPKWRPCPLFQKECVHDSSLCMWFEHDECLFRSINRLLGEVVDLLKKR